MIVGADEAGKGPVLGSMFAAAVRVADAGALPDGIRDSKELAPDRRGELAGALRGDDRVEVAVAEIPVERIDDPGTDMNTLTVEAHAGAIAGVVEPGDRVYLDAGDVSEARFARRVADRLDAEVDVRAEHGADADRPVVGAASVVAKVERDAHVERLASEHGEVGSGYPSDPATRAFLRGFLEEHGRLPACARDSWRTSRDLLADAEQADLDAF